MNEEELKQLIAERYNPEELIDIMGWDTEQLVTMLWDYIDLYKLNLYVESFDEITDRVYGLTIDDSKFGDDDVEL